MGLKPDVDSADFEVNFDGIVGPTHYFSGLSHGNVASQTSGGQQSGPKGAAKEGLAKMRVLHDLGVPQAVLPPQPRPDLSVLAALGFRGEPSLVLARVAKEFPAGLRAVSSASAMWAANAATVAPASDTQDGRLHLVVANLRTMFHRSLEGHTTHSILSRIFDDQTRYEVSAPLPGEQFADEGAANHTRLHAGGRTLHLFAWGRRAFVPAGTPSNGPTRYPARQTLEASLAVARLLALPEENVAFLRQHPEGIDGGAFHTDVVAVGHQDLLLAHELAFADKNETQSVLSRHFDGAVRVRWVSNNELPLEDAVSSYAFNSQLVSPNGMSGKVLIAPSESEQNPRARELFDRLLSEDLGIVKVIYQNVRQSMKNGGGPACLRQRIVLTDADTQNLAARGVRVMFDAALHAELETWVDRNYRDRLNEADLQDARLHDESQRALDELTGILGLGAVYDFQR